MLFVSCDIETTGLDSEKDQVLEVACVFWDTRDRETPVEELPTFHTYVTHPKITGDPFALSMHPTILRRIAVREEGWNYTSVEMVAWTLKNWVQEVKEDLIDAEFRAKLSFTGKNFGSFDLQFLRRLPNWEAHIRAKHRVLDPGTLYFNPFQDGDIPDMDTCCKRAGLLEVRKEGTPGESLTTKHDAVGDARIVIQLLRAKF